MVVLVGKDLRTVGVIHQQVLVTKDGEAIGILLGHCMFDSDGQVGGKFFKHTLYNLNGEILAKESAGDKIAIDENRLQAEGWKLVVRIKDHVCPMVDPQNKWADASLEEHFTEQIV